MEVSALRMVGCEDLMHPAHCGSLNHVAFPWLSIFYLFPIWHLFYNCGSLASKSKRNLDKRYCDLEPPRKNYNKENYRNISLVFQRAHKELPGDTQYADIYMKEKYHPGTREVRNAARVEAQDSEQHGVDHMGFSEVWIFSSFERGYAKGWWKGKLGTPQHVYWVL